MNSYPESAQRLVVAFTAVFYSALVLSLPFLGDFGVPTV